MRLDPVYLKYITKEELRVLLAVEMGMRNHEYVPVHLIEKISRLGRSCAFTYLKLLLKNKLVYHQRKVYDGYKLTYLGYDYLALNVLMKRGCIKEIVGKIGVGKESDIYKCINEEGQEVVLKFARLGRVSFKTVKNNRDYIQHRTQYNWLYLSRLQAIKEYSFMELLFENGFPTPRPYSQNRHGIVMSLADGFPMTQVQKLEDPYKVHNYLIDLIIKLAEHGLIHSDFNEFNLLIGDNYKITMIDFPQMVSTTHPNAAHYYERDIQCIHRFFRKKMKFESDYTSKLEEIQRVRNLDIEVKASGFVKKELGNLKDWDLLDEIQQAQISEDREEGLNSQEDEEEEDQEHSQDDNDDEEEDGKEEEDGNNDDEDGEDQEEVDGEEEKGEKQVQEKKKKSYDFGDIEGIEKKNSGDDIDFDLNEEGDFIQDGDSFEFGGEDLDNDNQQKQGKKNNKQDKKNKKKNGDKLREQLLEKIKLKEEMKKLQERKQQKNQENENENENEENDQAEDELLEQKQRVDYQNEQLKQRVEEHIKKQVDKKYYRKFKVQKFNKRGNKDVKDNNDYM